MKKIISGFILMLGMFLTGCTGLTSHVVVTNGNENMIFENDEAAYNYAISANAVYAMEGNVNVICPMDNGENISFITTTYLEKDDNKYHTTVVLGSISSEFYTENTEDTTWYYICMKEEWSKTEQYNAGVAMENYLGLLSFNMFEKNGDVYNLNDALAETIQNEYGFQDIVLQFAETTNGTEINLSLYYVNTNNERVEITQKIYMFNQVVINLPIVE